VFLAEGEIGGDGGSLRGGSDREGVSRELAGDRGSEGEGTGELSGVGGGEGGVGRGDATRVGHRGARLGAGKSFLRCLDISLFAGGGVGRERAGGDVAEGCSHHAIERLLPCPGCLRRFDGLEGAGSAGGSEGEGNGELRARVAEAGRGEGVVRRRVERCRCRRGELVVPRWLSRLRWSLLNEEGLSRPHPRLRVPTVMPSSSSSKGRPLLRRSIPPVPHPLLERLFLLLYRRHGPPMTRRHPPRPHRFGYDILLVQLPSIPRRLLPVPSSCRSSPSLALRHSSRRRLSLPSAYVPAYEEGDDTEEDREYPDGDEDGKDDGDG
jgi:hypothetical protein